MKPLILTLAALGAAISLAACSQKEAAAPAEAAAPPAAAPAAMPAAPAADMSKMDMSGDAKMGKGTGTVTAVTADSITVDHGPIPEVNWPAMTMGFKAPPALAKSVKVGDKVAFELKLQGDAGEITAIAKQ